MRQTAGEIGATEMVAKAAFLLVASLGLLATLGCVEPEPEPAGCVGEGGTVPVIAAPPECCAGLDLIPPKDPNLVGVMGYCTAKCGNGACDIESESEHNCPWDCVAGQEPAEQVVGPEYYESEGQAFDALGEELDGLEEPSLDELEALLGG